MTLLIELKHCLLYRIEKKSSKTLLKNNEADLLHINFIERYLHKLGYEFF